MTTEPTPVPPDSGAFEKTVRLVTRLDDADIDYVRDTSSWIERCVAHVLAHDPEAFPEATRATALDMSMRPRYRLMRPEIVAEQLVHRNAPTVPAPLLD
jgi:hypothetical protein